MKVLYYWLTMGPYHFSRMNAVARQPGVSLAVTEATNLDDHYWQRDGRQHLFDHHTIFENQLLDSKVTRRAAHKLIDVVDHIKPDILVNGAGYFDPVLHTRLRKIKKQNNLRLILWSESTRVDHKRRFWKEQLKKTFLGLYDGAVVAGTPHRQYLNLLGMQDAKIQVVGNVVDNQFYQVNQGEDIQRRGFLYIGRFLDIKNLDSLLKAYAEYRRQQIDANQEPHPLYLVGDGPERDSLEQFISRDNIGGVKLTGILQPPEVRKMYEQAAVFVLPSISEPWGLVVNEAMASGLPVLVSDRCGCSKDLVQDGHNGYLFDPFNPKNLADKMVMLDKNPKLRSAMGVHARNVISQYTPQTYAEKCVQFFQNIQHQNA